MFKKVISQYGFSIFYFLIAVSLEIFTFCLLDLGFLPENFLYDLFFILMFAGLIFISPTAVLQYLLVVVFSAVQMVILYANYSMYTFDGNFFSFDMLALAKEGMTAITSDYINVGLIVSLVVIFFVILAIGFYLYRIKKAYRTPYKKVFVSFMIMLLLVVQGLGVTIQPSLLLINNSDINQSRLNNTTYTKIGSYKLLGTFGYYINNLMENLTSSDEQKEKNKVINYFNLGKIYNETDSDVFGIAEDENVIVIMMESLEWFGFSDGTFNSHTFSSELTPNIYNLINESVIATDFFSKTKTNVSEGLGILGNFPVGSTLQDVVNEEKQDDFKYAITNILKDKGYTTSYIHAFKNTYYSRDLTHKYLGFDNVRFGTDYEENVAWKSFMEEQKFLNYCLEDGVFIPTKVVDDGMGGTKRVYTGEKFFSFYTTLTTHGSYSGYSHEDIALYKDFVLSSNWYQNVVDNYELSEGDLEKFVNYQTGVVGLDKTIGLIVQKLKEYGIYDNTTILLYSDHNSYLDDLSSKIKGISASGFSVELNTVPFILKSKNLTEKLELLNSNGNLNKLFCCADENGNLSANGSRAILSTKRFCSAYDIVPTLLDLLGIKYNKNLYIGKSLFTDIGDTIQVYKDDSYELTDVNIRAYYSSSTSSFYGNFSMTEDLVTYVYDYPLKRQYKAYESLIKELTNDCFIKINYMNCLFDSDIAKNIKVC